MMAFNKKMTFIFFILSFFISSFFSPGHCIVKNEPQVAPPVTATSGVTALTGQQSADSQNANPCTVVNTQANEVSGTASTTTAAPSAGVNQ